MVRLIILGTPGSGKGTYATRLHSKLGIPAIATGDIFREMVEKQTPLAKEIKSYMSEGKLVPDDIAIEILTKRLKKDDCRKGFILDGYPRTIKQAEALDKIAKIDAVIRLIVPAWIIVERLSSRRVCKNCGQIFNVRFLKPKKEGVCDKCEGELYQRPDDKPKVIRDRLKVYETQTQPLIKYYIGVVPFIEFKCESVDIPPEVAVANILEQLENLKPR